MRESRLVTAHSYPVRQNSFDGAVALYIRAMINLHPSVIRFNTGAGRILSGLMTNLPLLGGLEDQRAEFCRNIEKYVYPLVANLYAQAVAMVIVTSSRALRPPTKVDALTTFLAYDIEQGILRRGFLTPRETPDFPALSIHSGLTVQCRPLNYHYHRLKDWPGQFDPYFAGSALPNRAWINRNRDSLVEEAVWPPPSPYVRPKNNPIDPAQRARHEFEDLLAAGFMMAPFLKRHARDVAAAELSRREQERQIAPPANVPPPVIDEVQQDLLEDNQRRLRQGKTRKTRVSPHVAALAPESEADAAVPVAGVRIVESLPASVAQLQEAPAQAAVELPVAQVLAVSGTTTTVPQAAMPTQAMVSGTTPAVQQMDSSLKAAETTQMVGAGALSSSPSQRSSEGIFEVPIQAAEIEIAQRIVEAQPAEPTQTPEIQRASLVQGIPELQLEDAAQSTEDQPAPSDFLDLMQEAEERTMSPAVRNSGAQTTEAKSAPSIQNETELHPTRPTLVAAASVTPIVRISRRTQSVNEATVLQKVRWGANPAEQHYARLADLGEELPLSHMTASSSFVARVRLRSLDGTAIQNTLHAPAYVQLLKRGSAQRSHLYVALTKKPRRGHAPPLSPKGRVNPILDRAYAFQSAPSVVASTKTNAAKSALRKKSVLYAGLSFIPPH
jgi:hypothetical protein